VTERTHDIGEPPRKRFVGHLTIGRVKSHVPMPRVLGALVNAEFDVEEIALVHSRLDPQGSRYETIEAWPVG
jgi:2'-5' RNA ligase